MSEEKSATVRAVELTVHGASDEGRVRSDNQDSFLVDEKLGFFAVCDGLGGYTSGEIASTLAAKAAVNAVRERRNCFHGATDRALSELAEDVVHSACHEVYERATNDASCAGMGTTLTFFVIVGSKVAVGHVGDCRLYLHRDGEAHLLTTDHTVAQDMVRAGNLEATEAHTSRYSSILTRALGLQSIVQPDSLVFDVLPGDWLHLCSDGLVRHVPSEEEIARVLADSESSVEEAVASLVSLARERGGSDNITVVGVRVDSVEGERSSFFREIAGGLKAHRLFADLSFRKILLLLTATKTIRLRQGDAVVTEGEEVRGLYIVLEGELVAQGPEEIVFEPGASFGEFSLFQKRRARAGVRAREAARVLLVDRRALREHLKTRPRFGQRLLRRALEIAVDSASSRSAPVARADSLTWF